MIELHPDVPDAVSGGNIFLEALAVARGLYALGQGYVAGMEAVGGTLSNYYGQDMTLEIVAAGNMTA